MLGTREVNPGKKKLTAYLRMHRHNPIGKVFTGEELLAIGNLCVEHNIIMLSDEVSLG